MLRINQQKNAAAARSYFTTPSRGEYYAGACQELPGTWGGKSAALLNLVGEVAQADFDALCNNRTPDGGRLTARNRAGRTVGYDFNWHCPKSLSVLFGLTGDPAILDAFRSALATTLEEMERAMQTRIRKAGAMADRTTGNALWSQHIHLTARPVDGVPCPHLHAHAFLFNATFDGEERQWKASKIADIYRDAPYYQAVFHAHLARAVASHGFPVERTATGWEIAGLRDLLPKFSLRTAEIERIAAERGITDPAIKDGIGAATRKGKQRDLTMPELRRLWMARLNDDDRWTLANVAPAASAARPGNPSPAVSLDQAVATAIEQGFTKGHSLVPEKRLVALALSEAAGSITAGEVLRRLPAHGIVFRDYDGRRFCARRDPRSQPTAAELCRLAGIPSTRDGLDPADLPPGLAERQRSGYFLAHHRRRMIHDAEEYEAFPPPAPRASHGR